MEQSEKRQAEGGIDEDGIITIGDERFIVTRVTDKVNNKYPDWKGEKIGIWERKSKAKGIPYKFIRLDDKREFVAFKNRFAKDGEPLWRIFKSEAR